MYLLLAFVLRKMNHNFYENVLEVHVSQSRLVYYPEFTKEKISVSQHKLILIMASKNRYFNLNSLFYILIAHLQTFLKVEKIT